jgi:hypothetical protein
LHVEDILREHNFPRNLQLTYHFPRSTRQTTLLPDAPLGDLFRAVLALHLLERQSNGDNVGELTCSTTHVEELGAIGDRLENLFNYLTDTDVSLRFKKTAAPRQIRLSIPQSIAEVIPFSGGLDSFCGSVRNSSQKILVHGILNEIVYGRSVKLREDCPTLFEWPMVTCQCLYEGLAGGISQTRGLLFLTLAWLVSATLGSEHVTFAENGPLMLNPATSPLSPPTKNSDPTLVVEIESILSQLTESPIAITCPFKDMTKAEVVGSTPRRFQSLFGLTNSCHSTRSRGMCGICFGCFVRRMSLSALGCDETPLYSCDVFSQDLSDFGETRRRRMLDLRQSLRFFGKFLTGNQPDYYHGASGFFCDSQGMLRRFALDLLLGIHNLFELHPGYRTQNAFGKYCDALLNGTSPDLIASRKLELEQIRQV